MSSHWCNSEETTVSVDPTPAAARVCAGVDWAKDDHAVAVVGGEGQALHRFGGRHDRPGIKALITRLLDAAVSEVGIERPDGPVVDALLAAGLTVFVIQAQNPDIPATRIYRGTLGFLVADFVLVALLIAFPALALWLPAALRV